MCHVDAEQKIDAAVVSSGLRRHIKDLTADNHRRVDGLFSCFDLATAIGYKQFLVAQLFGWIQFSSAWKAGACDLLGMDAPDYAAMLREDLAELDCGISCPARDIPPGDRSNAAGMIYVLAGSRLGIAGMQADPNWGREQGHVQRFMRERSGLDIFRAVTSFLDDDSGRSLVTESVLKAARDCFRTFGEAAAQVRAARHE